MTFLQSLKVQFIPGEREGDLMRPLDFGNFDNVGIDSMCHRLKPTAVASETSLFTGLALGATVTIDALNVVAF